MADVFIEIELRSGRIITTSIESALLVNGVSLSTLLKGKDEKDEDGQDCVKFSVRGHDLLLVKRTKIPDVKSIFFEFP